MFKKVVCFFLSVSLISISSLSAFAMSLTNNTKLINSEQPKVNLFSKEFPNAYIESKTPIKVFDAVSNSQKKSFTATATVYVQENVAVHNNKATITSSRLLSKKEVDKIGRENFPSSSKIGSNSNGIHPNYFFDDHYNTKEKLTICLNGVAYPNRHGYQITMKGTWSARDGGPFFGYSTPSKGDDFMGLIWGGQFDTDGLPLAYAKDDKGLDRPTTLCAATPQTGLVWSFHEGSESIYNSYVTNFLCSTDLIKNALTGNGNTTDFVGQYIHTYQDFNSSINFSYGSLPGFSLSNVSNQWSLVAYIDKIPY